MHAATPSAGHSRWCRRLRVDTGRSDRDRKKSDHRSGGSRTFDILTVNNNTVASGTVVAVVPANFQLDGIGDFNHDGTSDIAMHADTGTTRNDWIFSIANNVLTKVHIVATTGLDWHVSWAGDMEIHPSRLKRIRLETRQSNSSSRSKLLILQLRR
jgi:hypothetical protein